MQPTVSTRSAENRNAETHSAELEAVRIRRAELRESISALESAIAAPAPGRAVVWGEAVRDALNALTDDFGEHIEVTEGHGGLYESILAGDLRLANAVDALKGEHGELAEEIAELVATTNPPVTPADVDEVRDRATRLITNLIRHRQRGADLVYEAFATDIGGGD